jgi:hypothetical protein
MAAVLASGEGAALSHWSAAALWMIRPNSRSMIDVTVPHRSRSSKLIRRHISIVPDDECTIEEGIPVTTVPRTIFDLAATEPVDVIKNLLRESEYRRLWDRLSLWDLVERYPGKRGGAEGASGAGGDQGNKRFQVDCHWVGTNQIVELDGWDKHSTRSAFREDRALRVAGYSVTRLTWNQLDDEPEAIAADLRVLLRLPGVPH